jgi:NTE family protein
MIPRCFLAFCLLLSIPSAAQAPQPASPAQPSPRPKIGLVFEGGGALGLAHVGVLRWFEQHHIPVDYIAGTSLGGVVAGLYATGQSGDEVREFMRGIHWDETLRGEVPYDDLSFRRKEDKQNYPNSLEFGYKKGVQFPSGLNSGQQVGLILDRVSLPYSDTSSFDDLPTPFRCVATDLVTGKAHVFDHAPLSLALRSTMSLPAIFNPVRTAGQIYVDGGLLDNLPVDVARRMGADIVIAVHLQTKPLNPDEPLSLFAVLNRSINVVVARNELESMEKADLLINVDLQQFGSSDFEQAEKIMQVGFDAAAERARVLSNFSVDESSWQQYLEQRQSRRRSVPVPSFVEVEGPNSVIANGIRTGFSQDIGKPLDTGQVERDLTLLTGLGRFSLASYSITRRGNEDGLLIRVNDKDYAPPIINPLLLIDGSDYNNVRFSVGARLTFLDVGGFGSEWRNDFIFGSQYGVASEYYHPLHWASHWFVAPRAFASSKPFDLHVDNRLQAQYRKRDIGMGVDFGIAISRDAEFRVGYQVEHSRLNLEVGPPTLQSVAGTVGVSTVKYSFDHTDDAVVPRQGTRITSRLQWYDANPGASEHFPLIESQLRFFQRTSLSSSVFLLASGGSTAGYRNTGLPVFSLGGPLRLGAYGTNEFLTNQYFLFQPGYIRRLTQLSPLLGDNVYFISSLEVGKAYNVGQASHLPADISAAILVQTFFGPVILGGSLGDTGHRKVYFQVGRLF